LPAEGFFRAGRSRPGPNVHGPPTGPSGSSRPGGGSSRRPRWDTDAGITDRDVAALRWLGQQYAARSDVLRVLLGRLSPGSPRVEGLLGEETLRDVVARWEDRGLIDRDRLLGHLWVAPTVKALRLVGLDVRAWSFVIPQLAHVHAVGVVRLALEPSIPAGGRWLSERELTRKGAARLRESWMRPRHGRWIRTAYYAPPEVAGYLTGQLQRIRPRHSIQVHPLPEVPGTTYMRPGGAT
jgi:hypothetical protein